MTAESQIRPRLRRLDSVYIPSPIYFITAKTAVRKKLLSNDRIHGAFLAFAKKGEGRGGKIGAYVLMPDHLHLFVVLGESIRLDRWGKSLKNALSKVLRDGGVPVPHWQKGFFDHVLRSAESYSQKWAYVRNNPVRAGLVADHAEWPYAGELSLLEHSNRG